MKSKTCEAKHFRMYISDYEAGKIIVATIDPKTKQFIKLDNEEMELSAPGGFAVLYIDQVTILLTASYWGPQGMSLFFIYFLLKVGKTGG